MKETNMKETTDYSQADETQLYTLHSQTKKQLDILKEKEYAIRKELNNRLNLTTITSYPKNNTQDTYYKLTTAETLKISEMTKHNAHPQTWCDYIENLIKTKTEKRDK